MAILPPPDPRAQSNLTNEQVDNLLCLATGYSDVIDRLAERLNEGWLINKQEFREAFTEQIRDLSHLIPDSLDGE